MIWVIPDAAVKSSLCPLSPAEPVPGTSKEQPACRQTPKHSRTRLNFSIEVPSPSQVRTEGKCLIDETNPHQ